MYLSDGLFSRGGSILDAGSSTGSGEIKSIDGYAYNEDGTYKHDKHGIPLRTGKPVER